MRVFSKCILVESIFDVLMIIFKIYAVDWFLFDDLNIKWKDIKHVFVIKRTLHPHL